MTTQTYQVRDGSRLLEFEGKLIASVSSRKPGSTRWTEMWVYITEGGSYVLEKLGQSIVCHMPGCPDAADDLPRFQAENPGDDPDNGYEFHDCVPELYDFPSLLIEEPRYWALVSKQPEEIVEALYRRRYGVRTLPRVAMNLLEQVSAADPNFGDEWRMEKVT